MTFDIGFFSFVIWRARRDGAGKALGIMGMVRKHRPKALTNERFGWIGDIHNPTVVVQIAAKKYRLICPNAIR